MRHRACDCTTRPHRLIRATFTAALTVLAAAAMLRAGVAVGSADLAGRSTPSVYATTATTCPPTTTRAARD